MIQCFCVQFVNVDALDGKRSTSIQIRTRFPDTSRASDIDSKARTWTQYPLDLVTDDE